MIKKYRLARSAATAVAAITFVRVVNAAIVPVPMFMDNQQVSKWQTERAVRSEGGKQVDLGQYGEKFFTGRPYDESSEAFLFKFRSYDSELGRWKTMDPSGFPDQANNIKYVDSPTSQIDPFGLESYTYTYSYYGYYKKTGGETSLSVTANFSSAVLGLAVKGMTGTVLSAVASSVASVSGSPSNYELVRADVLEGWEAGAPPSGNEYTGLSRASGTLKVEERSVYFPHDENGNENINDEQSNFFDPMKNAVLYTILSNGGTPSPSQWAEQAPEDVAYPGGPGSYSLGMFVVEWSASFTIEVE